MSSPASAGISHSHDEAAKTHLSVTDFNNQARQGDRLSKTKHRQTSVIVERLLTVSEVANRLGMSQQWVRDHIDRRSPKIDVVRWGAAVRFRAADVDRFILEHVNAPRQRKRSR
jgi:excisionase family DNA binding protein